MFGDNIFLESLWVEFTYLFLPLCIFGLIEVVICKISYKHRHVLPSIFVLYLLIFFVLLVVSSGLPMEDILITWIPRCNFYIITKMIQTRYEYKNRIDHIN